jgi:hypothetical protein
MAWVLGRTQTNGPEDYESVHRVQDGYTITPLSAWGQQPDPVEVTVDPTVDMSALPVDQVNQMKGAEFFGYAADLLRVHPPHATDWSMLARMRRIGVKPGEPFDSRDLEPEIRQAMETAVVEGQAAIRANIPRLAPQVNGWQYPADTMGVYGNYYLKRATLAMGGLGSNPPEDAIYPLTFNDGDGRPLDGAHEYRLRFDADGLPPVKAFWSLSLYDQQGFQVPNDLDRVTLGGRDPLRYSPDGSLELFIQQQDPSDDRTSNWLPAPAGPFALFLRLYEPTPAVFDGTWKPPVVRRLL